MRHTMFEEGNHQQPIELPGGCWLEQDMVFIPLEQCILTLNIEEALHLSERLLYVSYILKNMSIEKKNRKDIN